LLTTTTLSCLITTRCCLHSQGVLDRRAEYYPGPCRPSRTENASNLT
jgi:hypothetical protein